MIRQSSSRNQRSKGVRVKYILQICMLLAVCCWLIYQVKHSYDKRNHFEENDGEISGEKLPKFDEVVKLGRKDLRPRDEELSTNHEKIDDEEVEDEETLGKGDETLEETQEELERKRKKEGSADIEALLDGTSRGEEAGGEAGNDDIDEQDIDKVEKESDGDEEVVDGDKEDIEKDEENETDGKDGDDDNEHQIENDGSLDDQDHDSNGDTHEAREEHYKADDASSAVAHVAQNLLTENPEHRNGNTDLDEEHSNSSDETGVAKEQHLNDTIVLKNSNEMTPPRLENVLVKNDTSDASSENVRSTPLDEEEHVLRLKPEQDSMTGGLSDETSSNTINATENNPTIFTRNTTEANVEHDEKSNSTMSLDFSSSDLVVGSNVTSGTINNSIESFNTDEQAEDAIQDRKEDTEDDSILSSLNDDETLRDPLISEEEDKERENLIDLDTLPELRTEGTDSDDAATE